MPTFLVIGIIAIAIIAIVIISAIIAALCYLGVMAL